MPTNPIYAYFNNLLALSLDTTNSSLLAGAVNEDELFVHFVGKNHIDYPTATITFKRSDGTISPELVMQQTSFVYDGTTFPAGTYSNSYSFLFYDDWILALSGLLEATVRLYGVNGNVLVSGKLTLSVQSSVFSPETTITPTQYTNLVNQINSLATNDNAVKIILPNCRNDDSVSLTIGMPVYASGSIGASGKVKIKRASALSTAPQSNKLLGIVADNSIAVGADGNVLILGELQGVNTNTIEIIEGQPIFVSTTAGQLTSTAPTAPNHRIVVGGTIRKANNGIIYVKQQLGLDVAELCDVQITTVENGNTLRYNSSTLRWENTNALTTAEANITNLQGRMTTEEGNVDNLQGRMTTAESDIDQAQTDISSLNNNKADKATTIIGIDLQNNITLEEFKTELGNATQSVAGLLSAADKTHLDGLVALLNTTDGDNVVNTIGEILEIFDQYPEGFDLVNAFAGKVDKVAGKELSTNDLTNTLKTNYDTAYNHSQITDGTNPHQTTFANIQTKPTTIGGYGITDAYTKTQIDTSLSGKADIVDGKIPAGQLPSYVDDVLEAYARDGATPAASNWLSLTSVTGDALTAEAGKIYVIIGATDTDLIGKTYRWAGSTYAVVGNIALGETAATAFAGNRGVALEGVVNTANQVDTGVVTWNASTGKFVSANNFIKTSDGNVGIGTTSPLNLTGAGYRTLAISGTSTGALVDLMVGATRLGIIAADTNTTSVGSIANIPLLLQTNDTERMRILANGNVGIGTTSPDVFSRFHGRILGISTSSGNSFIGINGASGSNGGVEMGAGGTRTGIISSNATTMELGSVTNIPLSMVTNGFTRMTITGGGNVGIGTTSPSENLEVSGGNVTSIKTTGVVYSSQKLFTTFDFSENRNWEIRTNAFGPGAWGGLAIAQSNAKFGEPFGAGTVRFGIDTNGNVGIGTASPNQLLEVKGAGLVYAKVSSGTNSSFRGLAFGIENDATVYGNVSMELNGGELRHASGFATWGGFQTFLTNGTEKMRILSNGNVGIGTATPNAQLSLGTSVGTAGEPNKIVLYDDGSMANRIGFGVSGGQMNFVAGANTNQVFYTNGNNERMRITSAGNVGIGTNAPSEKLHVVGNARIEGNLTVNGSVTQVNTNVANTERLTITNDGTGPAIIANQTGAQPVVDFQDDGVSAFYIADGGNVGIGTTTPASKLQVVGSIIANESIRIGDGGNYTNGSIYSDASWGMILRARRINPSQAHFRFADSSDSELMRINTAGNVGIGTAAPAFRLDVSGGDIRVQNGGNVSDAGGSINFNAVANFLPMAQIKGLLGFSGNPSGVNQDQGELAFYTRPITGNNENLVERLRISNTGNIGIGTTAPASILHLNGTGYFPTKMITLSGAEPTRYNANIGTNIVSGDSIALSFGTRNNNTNYDNTLNIRNGNVGIGTTAPDSRLVVDTVATFAGGTNFDRPHFTLKSGATGASGTTRLAFMVGSGNQTYLESIRLEDNDNITAFAIRVRGSGDNVAERMRILGNGNVGIGTSSPADVLHIVNNTNNAGIRLERTTATTGNYTFGIKSTGAFEIGETGVATRLLITKTDGLVGINETTLSAQLQVKSGATNRIPLILNTIAAHTVSLQEWQKAGTVQAWIEHTGVGNFVNGINVRNPAITKRLSIYFDDALDAGVVRSIHDNVAFKNTLINPDAGNVGIGTTTPSVRLEVNGLAKFDGTPSNAQTGDYTLVLADKGRVLRINSSSNRTVTIPLNSSVAFPIDTEIAILRYGSGTVSISPTAGVTLQSKSGERKISGQYSSVALKKIDENEWVLVGSLEA